jgi:hypothetical protein
MWALADCSCLVQNERSGTDLSRIVRYAAAQCQQELEEP